MKVLLPVAIAVSGVALAMGSIDLWDSSDDTLYEYQTRWLGGDLSISATQKSTDENELRIKMTGAGSIPQNSSEYFVTSYPSGAELPATFELLKTNEEWEPNRRQDARRNGEIAIDLGNREVIEGTLQTYAFSADAVAIGPNNALNLWNNSDTESYIYTGNWLGGELEIDSVELEGNKAQIRIKMTGAGSIPQNSSEYFVTEVENGIALPLEAALTKTNASWVPRPRQDATRNGSVQIDLGNREVISGVLQTYDFSAEATNIDE